MGINNDTTFEERMADFGENFQFHFFYKKSSENFPKMKSNESFELLKFKVAQSHFA